MKVSKRRKSGDGSVDSSTDVIISFEKALEAFLLAQEAAALSRMTYRDYRCVIGLFLRYMAETHGYTAIHQVTEEDVLEWLAHFHSTPSRKGRPYSSRSIETYSRDVSVFFHWLVEHHYLEVNPMAQVRKPKVEKPLIRVFTEDELARLDAACERAPKGKALTPDERKALTSRDRAFLWLLLSTGVRLSEACGLLFSDVDWESGMIYVRGKGAKERRVPIGKVARQYLNTYIRYWRGEPTVSGDDHVFLGAYGDPLTPGAGQRIFMRLKRVSGIIDKRVSAHTCRHWFAVNCIKRGMPSTVLQGLLGHERLEMINTYVKLAEQDNRELYARYSPVDVLELHHLPGGKRQKMREWRNARKKSSKREGDVSG